jgi:hypothetical protein
MSKILDELSETPTFYRIIYGVDKPNLPPGHYRWDDDWGHYEESDKAFRERIELKIKKEK